MEFKFDIGQLVQFKTRPGVSFCVGVRSASFSSDESGKVPRVPNYHVSRLGEGGEKECWPNVLEWELEPYEKPAACCLMNVVTSVIDLRGKGEPVKDPPRTPPASNDVPSPPEAAKT